MPKERDPRVVAIAKELVKIQPYGKDFRKTEPSVADYHAALIAVRTLDEQVEFEYNVRVEDQDGFYNTWSTEKEMSDFWGCENLDEVSNNIPESWTLIKRRKAGGIEDV